MAIVPQIFMEFELSFGYHDAMMLFHDDDEKDVKELCTSIENNVVLNDKQRPRIVLYPRIALACGNNIDALEFGFERCTFVMLYVTAKFVKDVWSKYSRRACLMKAIECKPWCMVPVYIDDTPYPFEFNQLKGIHYSHGDFEAIKILFNDRISVRKRNEKQHLQKQIQWVSESEMSEIQSRSTDENYKPTELSVAQNNDQLLQSEIVSKSLSISREDEGRDTGTSVDQDIVTDNPSPSSNSDPETDDGFSSSVDELEHKTFRNSYVNTPSKGGAQSTGSLNAETTEDTIGQEKLQKAVSTMSITDQEKARIKGIERGSNK